ncbi:lysosomal thioesterase PPT2-B-like [Bolinopsis microptera]|uniref:lysosomal thioesterase PPT2-B-like n=1 Tax=Bolinopsis microptera TaxID=2820187 RepID=UPI003079431F
MLSLVSLVLVAVTCVDSYKVGIIHMHGVVEGYYEHNNFKKFIERNTGIPVHLLDAYNYAASITPMQYQVPDILPRVKKIAAQYDKVIAVGYSQGGLIWRAMIEEWDDHNVELFISLASPQHGVYGAPPLAETFVPFLHWYSRTTIYKVLYTFFGQTFSMFNYYLDPTHYNMYLEEVAFFPELNNELSSISPEEKERKKMNFLKLKKLALIGGESEDVIDPWQSTMFGSYTDEGFDGEVIPMEETKMYRDNLFGLRTLDERGGIVKCKYDGLTHLQFRDNQGMLTTCILPLLQPYFTDKSVV